MSFAIHDGSVSHKEKVLQLALKSPVHYGQLFLQSDFKINTASAYHYEIGYIMDNKKDLKPTIYMLPRGHAKTKLTQASILKDITTFEWDEEAVKRWFIVWVAQNKTQSMRNVNFIMKQIETNEKIKYYFGDLRGSGKHKWNQEELDFRNDCSLICRAGLHGIRGLLKDELRPNRFILDDFEYEGNTKTQHSRNTNAETVTSVIIPGLDPEIGRLQINQTPVHYDAFVMRIWDSLQSFVKDGGNPSDFEWRVYKKSTKIDNPLWPEYFNSELLRRRKSQLIQAGQLHTWFQEYEMEVTTDETSLFGKKCLRYWDGELKFQGETTYLHITSINHERTNKKIPVLVFQGCDPSSDIETRTSSDTAIINIAIDHDGNIYSIDYLCKKNLPDIALNDDKLKMGTANQILIRCKRDKARRSGVEKHAVSAGVFNSIAKVKEDHDEFKDVVVIPLSHKGERKIDRIYNGLISHFNSRKIHIKDDHSRLETEIITFGEFAKYIDLLDALEMAVRVSYKPAVVEIEEDTSIPMDPWEINRFYEKKSSNWKTV
jgi:hypothetical protein